MKLNHTDIDMLHGPLAKKILLFTIPIALSSMLQQLFNAADVAVVGLVNDANALAAVGTNTEIVALIVTVSTGLAVGANLLIANRIGQGAAEKLPVAVQTALLLAMLVGIAGCLLGQLAVRPLLLLIQTPAAILSKAELYLRIYLLGYPFLLLYDFASAALRARGDSRYPFIALALSGGANAVLNLFFVLVLSMGVAGAAAATAVSTLLSAVMVLLRLAKDPLFCLDVRHMHFSRIAMAALLKTGIPSAVQGAVFCLANIFVQASVNTFGEAAIAGSAIAMNFEYFTYYIITAFGQTATTFAGQNFAAGKKRRCKRILGLCLGLSALCSSIPIFSIVLLRNFFSGLFSLDTAVIEAAAGRVLSILLYEPLCNFYEIPAGLLRGSGHSFYPAAAAIIGTCALRILWICTVFREYHTLPMLYHAFPLSWLATIVLTAVGFSAVRPCAPRSH